MKDLLIKNGYYVHVRQHESQQNVIIATFPRNFFNIPILDEEIIQYYLEDTSIIVTNLNTKQTLTVPIKLSQTRAILMCDIFARCKKRNIATSLIVFDNIENSIISFLNTPEYLKSEDKRIIEILKCRIKQEKNKVSKKDIETYDMFDAIIKSGGLL